MNSGRIEIFVIVWGWDWAGFAIECSTLSRHYLTLSWAVLDIISIYQGAEQVYEGQVTCPETLLSRLQ